MSGLFSNGTQRGGNASLSWLACIVCTWEAIRYLNGHEKPWRLLFVWIATSCIASMTEIKLLFLQQLMIAGLSVLLCRKSRRSIWMVLLAGSSFFVGVQLLYLLYPGFDNFFLPNILAGYITRDDLFPNMQSGDSSGLNRLTAISYMLENFLHTWPQRLFGIGLGNGDYSKFSFLTSDFYRLHWDLPYTFFSSAMVTLELGLVGLGAYCLWFFNFIRRALCCHPKTEPDRSAVSMTIILGLMVYVMILSNQTMKLETTSYLVGCVLTFPFLITEKKEV